MLDSSTYQNIFAGFGIRDCAVRNRDVFDFVCFEDWDDSRPRPFDEELETRIASLRLKEPERWRCARLQGYGGLRASGCTVPHNQLVAVDRMGQVLSAGEESGGFEQPVPGGRGQGPARGGVTRVKSIQGRLYGCGGLRSVFRREGNNRWETVGPLPPTRSGEVSFQDVDGFSESDLYAVGGRGDVWWYDGVAWRQVPFPSDMWLESVCCGADGQVYIGAQSGTVYRGRGDTWVRLHEGDLSLPFRDMVFFQGRIYATNDYGLWEIQGDRVEASEQTIDVTNCAGNLAVGDGVMLLAGAYGAALHDGRSWKRLFNLVDL